MGRHDEDCDHGETTSQRVEEWLKHDSHNHHHEDLNASSADVDRTRVQDEKMFVYTEGLQGHALANARSPGDYFARSVAYDPSSQPTPRRAVSLHGLGTSRDEEIFQPLRKLHQSLSVTALRTGGIYTICGERLPDSHRAQSPKSLRDGSSSRHTTDLEQIDLEPVTLSGSSSDDELQRLIQIELESKWILNLSMRLRDKTDREKFFVTYAEQPNRWRRITVTIDYKYAAAGTLEADVKNLSYQRDKSARIYESMRESLFDIQFYKTVTNLKLSTIDDRLHVHCSEDKNEIIPYPHAMTLSYLPYSIYREVEVCFAAHISGFVYKVHVDGQIMVKKEIPGPGSVDEFLYEVTALASMHTAEHVIGFRGLVVDNAGHNVTGLLINFAGKGALIDLLYADRQTNKLQFDRREKWARQIIKGLSEVHEAGFVQGDLTLSNIVVDDRDDAWLIDMNRRGCPMGWEPPELEVLIRAGHHISMFIGVKTDLFQLGMVLWALGMCVDEPDLEPRPLHLITKADVPSYYKDIVENCLQSDPRNRLPAKELLALLSAERGSAETRTLPVHRVPQSCDTHSIYTSHDRDDFLTVPSRTRDCVAGIPSQASEVSSIRTTGLDTTASSDYMSDVRTGSAQQRSGLRDWSPVSRSDLDQPQSVTEPENSSKA